MIGRQNGDNAKRRQR